MDDLSHSEHHQAPSNDPHIRQTQQYREFLERAGDISYRVIQVLDFMDSLQLNLPLLLWAPSWNVPDLTSNHRAQFARTSLMLSEELPQILDNWYCPPRSHGRGIHTAGARHTLSSWALNTVCRMIDKEFDALVPVFRFPQEELSEKSLLDIKIHDLISQIKVLAPNL